MSQLSDLKIRKAQPKDKFYTLADGDGLFLNVTPTGSKIWHFRFYWQNKQCRISFGNYPAVDLRTARTLRQDAQSQLARGIDPRDERKAAKAAAEVEKKLTFAEFAQTWMDFKIKRIGASKSPNGRQSTVVQLRRYMHKDFLPILGKLALTDITRVDVVKVIRNIEERGALAIAMKCRGWLNEMFRHALAEGLVASNLAADLDIVSLPKPAVQHNPFLRMDEMPAFMAALSRYPGHTQTGS